MADSQDEIRSNDARDASVARVDMKLEVVVIPVSDVDRAKEFYGRLGWRLDADFRFDNGFRVVQFTPPGSGCSVQFGKNITSAAPGSAQGLYLIVSDIEAARDELRRPRRRGQRGLPRRDAGRSVPARRHERSRQRSRARASPATAPSPRSATPTATAGCCRRSRRGFPGASTPADVLRLRERPGERASARRGRPRRSTRSGPGKPTRTGRTGTPSTWCASRPAKSCRNERLRAYPRAVCGEADRHILLTGHRKMSQSPTVLG